MPCLQMRLADGKLNVRALQGALVGPPWSKRQYGWHFSEAAEGGVTVYYEPHANHDLKSVQSVGQVDIAIIPTESTYAAGAPLCACVSSAIVSTRFCNCKVECLLWEPTLPLSSKQCRQSVRSCEIYCFCDQKARMQAIRS